MNCTFAVAGHHVEFSHYAGLFPFTTVLRPFVSVRVDGQPMVFEFVGGNVDPQSCRFVVGGAAHDVDIEIVRTKPRWRRWSPLAYHVKVDGQLVGHYDEQGTFGSPLD